MQKNRLEVFTDGVIAIIITIMVLELKVPHGGQWRDLMPLVPIFLSYILSFLYIGTYWNNHHYTLHTVSHVSLGILWTNLNALFWLSLIPFTTAWMGENSFASATVVLYAINLLLSALSYEVLQFFIVKKHGYQRSFLSYALENNQKGKLLIFLYILTVIFAIIDLIFISLACFIIACFFWFIPDKRIAHILTKNNSSIL